ncbi:MAG: prepilin-type N-terminal cleavage/methylation domain-containing protein [Candidatus Omnitrophota bacterium]|nr:prepilin-type N-terminal cleavage/methylation domain-containing protein [Candidatus Omnitrophota bacterium]
MAVDKKGFSMIELIVVGIVVAILAAMALPMMTGSVDRAKRAEAVAALGAIRTAERLYSAEHSNVYIAVAATEWGAGGPLAAYIRDTDLNGRYFTSSCYVVAIAPFLITCTGADSTQVAGQGLGVITMNINGDVVGY